MILLLLVVQVFPARLLAKAAGNALLGVGALLLLHATSSLTGIHLGVNIFNLLVAGILGAPGVGLLLLVSWVLL